MRNRRLVFTALLCAIALTIFVLEAQLPVPLPVPGLKLGLANVVTVFALAALGRREALAVVLIRIVLGNAFTGQGMALLYALAGGLLSYLVMALVLPVLQKKQLWVAGVLGGICHNLAQMAVALAITRTPALLWYLPVLLLCGCLTGALTGLSAQLLVRRLGKLLKNWEDI